MTNDVGHLSMCLLAIYIVSLKNCLLRSFCLTHFKIGLPVFLLMSLALVLISYVILGIYFMWIFKFIGIKLFRILSYLLMAVGSIVIFFFVVFVPDICKLCLFFFLICYSLDCYFFLDVLFQYWKIFQRKRYDF